MIGPLLNSAGWECVSGACVKSKEQVKVPQMFRVEGSGMNLVKQVHRVDERDGIIIPRLLETWWLPTFQRCV